jgi:hypothetical protein
MDIPITGFVHAGSLEELKAKGRLVVRGRTHRPILVVHDRGHVFARAETPCVAIAAASRIAS